MLNKKIVFSFLILGFVGLLFMTSCKPDDTVLSTGQLNLEITDAPADDASIQGVFITVAEVKVDGKSYEGFQGKQTIDIMAYQRGETKALGLAELEAGTYSNITLVLDTETDADGNSPGCYVLTTDNEKEDLAASGQSSLEISSQHAISIAEDASSSIVLDFDLRKSVQYESSSSSEATFSFVSQNELNASLRAVDVEASGTIEGSFDSSLFEDPDKVVIYAYAKGTFDKDAETQGEANGEIAFENAITSSAAVKSGSTYSYTLSFLEEGEYEICLVSYQQDDDGSASFDGFLSTSLSLDASVTSEVSVSAGLASTLSLNILGVLR